MAESTPHNRRCHPPYWDPLPVSLWIVISVLVVVPTLCTLLVISLIAPSSRLIAECRTENGESIRVFAPGGWHEVSRNLTYEIRSDGDILVPERTLYNTDIFVDSRLSFGVLTSTNGDVIAISEALAPDTVLLLFNRSNGQLWDGQSDGTPGSRQCKKQLLAEIQANYPGRSLK